MRTIAQSTRHLPALASNPPMGHECRSRFIIIGHGPELRQPRQTQHRERRQGAGMVAHTVAGTAVRVLDLWRVIAALTCRRSGGKKGRPPLDDRPHGSRTKSGNELAIRADIFTTWRAVDRVLCRYGTVHNLGLQTGAHDCSGTRAVPWLAEMDARQRQKADLMNARLILCLEPYHVRAQARGTRIEIAN